MASGSRCRASSRLCWHRIVRCGARERDVKVTSDSSHPAEKPPKSVPSIFFERRAIEKEIETAGMKPPSLATGKQVAASQNVYRARNGD